MVEKHHEKLKCLLNDVILVLDMMEFAAQLIALNQIVAHN